MTSLWHHQGLSSPSVPQGKCQAPSRLSTCPLRRPACIAAPPPTCWERRTATSTCPSTAVSGCSFTHNPSLPPFSTATWVVCNVFPFLRSPWKFLGHAAGRAAHLVHVPGAAGAAGARAVAPSHGPGREVEAREGGGVLQRDTLHSVSDEALVCMISQKKKKREILQTPRWRTKDSWDSVAVM